MTIASMEELEAMAPGSSVKVVSRRIGTRTFVRTEAGFEYEGVTVEPQWFAGHVTAGQVTNFGSGDPEVGDMYSTVRRFYLVTAVTAGTVYFLEFTHDGAYRSSASRTLDRIRALTWTRMSPQDYPAWQPMALRLGSQMQAVEAENKRVAEQWNEAQRLLGEANLNLTRMREERTAQVQVVATGVTRLPLEKAAGQVPDKVTVVDVLASWRREFTVTTEPAAGCQCGITREQVIELLGIEGQSEHADFGFQVDCGRH